MATTLESLIDEVDSLVLDALMLGQANTKEELSEREKTYTKHKKHLIDSLRFVFADAQRYRSLQGKTDEQA